MGFLKKLFGMPNRSNSVVAITEKKPPTQQASPQNKPALKQSPEFKKIISDCKRLKTDLVEKTAHHPTCGECAKYQGRIYSLSGADGRFPKLPDFIFERGCVHEDCRHLFYPYVYGLSSPAYIKGDPRRVSNRPFVDDRPEQEKIAWDEMERARVEEVNDRYNYSILAKKLPEIAPKSFSGYRRMKNANTDNYRRLMENAKEKDIKLK